MAVFGGSGRAASAVIRLLPEKAVCRILCAGQTRDLPVDVSMLSRGEICSALEHAVAGGQKYVSPVSAVFILPHSFYGVDFVTLPAIKKVKAESFRTELRSMYKNYDDLVFLSSDLYTGKSSVTYRVAFAPKQVLTGIKNIFSKINVTVDRFLPFGAAVIEGAAKLNSALRRTPCLVLDMEEKYSYLAAYGKDTLIGGMEIPFGVEALSDVRVMSERMLYQHDSAELLVINARERAKSTKLTMAINLEEAKIDDSVLSDEDEIPENPELPDLTRSGEEKAPAVETEADEFDDEDDETGRPEQAAAPSIKTLRKSLVRQLPKFMQREVPTTPGGFVVENFRLFEKRILLIARDMALNEYFPRMEAVYLSVPQRYAFLAEEMNKANPTIKWSHLKNIGSGVDDLPMSGAMNLGSGKMPVFQL